MNEIKDMTKKERAEIWQQVAAYVEQLERAVETQRAQLKRRQERINALKARARAERTCKNVYEGSDIDRYMMFKCSNCGCVLANHYYPKGWIEQEHTDDEFFAYDGERLNYCPNCGAKVIGG